MAHISVMFRPTEAALETPSQQASVATVLNANAEMQTYISALPGVIAQFCSPADHKAALAADARLGAPKLLRLCGPKCRYMVAEIVRAQLFGTITSAQFDAINSARPDARL
jgi:hypothetical protein